MTPDPYEVLGVARDATAAQIMAAYRKLSKKHHPDRAGDAELMRAINQAYETLSDPEKRRRFDECGDGDFDLEREAQSACSSLFYDLLDHASEELPDIIAASQKVVRKRQDETRTAIASHEQALARYERLGRRIRRTSDGLDFFSVVRDQRERESREQIAASRRVMKIHDRVLELLKEYQDAGAPNALHGWGIDTGNGETVIICVTGGNRRGGTTL